MKPPASLLAAESNTQSAYIYTTWYCYVVSLFMLNLTQNISTRFLQKLHIYITASIKQTVTFMRSELSRVLTQGHGYFDKD